MLYPCCSGIADQLALSQVTPWIDGETLSVVAVAIIKKFNLISDQYFIFYHDVI